MVRRCRQAAAGPDGLAFAGLRLVGGAGGLPPSLHHELLTLTVRARQGGY